MADNLTKPKINMFKTGLYPIDASDNPTLFYAKSNCIKAYPASWRNIELYADETGKTSDAVFDVEAVLHTEYNITRTAGALKHYLDDKDTDGEGSYTFKFFLNGYSFEVNNLDVCKKEFDDAKALVQAKQAAVSKAESETDAAAIDVAKAELAAAEYALENNTGKVNLYVGIRTLAQHVGNSELDVTQVLVPYGDTNIDAPVYLDRKIKNLFSEGLPSYNANSNTPIEDDELDANKKKYVYANDENFVFTGLVFSKNPIVLPPDMSAENNYYSIQILENGEFCTDLMWPNIKAGQALEQSSVLIGQLEPHSLKAPDPGMVAMGQYNSTREPDSIQRQIVAVGIGNDDDHRRNAFEITGVAPETPNSNGTYEFDTHVSSGPFDIHYSNSLESDNKDAEVSGIYSLNTGIELAKDGSKIIINRPVTDADGQSKVVTNTEIGLHSYGNINILGSSLYFKDTSYAGETDRSIAAMTVKDMVNGTTVVDRGLHMTGIADINNGAVTFRPGTVAGSFTLNSINNQGIIISATADEITFNNQYGVKLKNAELQNIKKIVNNAGFNINNLSFKDNYISNITNIIPNNDLSFKTDDAIKITDGSNNIRCIFKEASFNGNTTNTNYSQVVQFAESLKNIDNSNTTKMSGAELWGVQGLYRNSGLGEQVNPEDENSAYIKLNTSKITTPAPLNSESPDVEINGTTVLNGNLKVTGEVSFGTMTIGSDTSENSAFIQSLIDCLYPIGSIYMTMENFNLEGTRPAWFKADQWELTAQGRTLFGVLDTDNETVVADLNKNCMNEAVSGEVGVDKMTYFTAAENKGGSYTPAIPLHVHGLSDIKGLFASTDSLLEKSVKNNSNQSRTFYLPEGEPLQYLTKEEDQLQALGYTFETGSFYRTDRNGMKLSNEIIGNDGLKATYELSTPISGTHYHELEIDNTTQTHRHELKGHGWDGVGDATGVRWSSEDDASFWSPSQNYVSVVSQTHKHNGSTDNSGSHSHIIDTKHFHRTAVDFSGKNTSGLESKNNVDSIHYGNLPPYTTCYIWKRVKLFSSN